MRQDRGRAVRKAAAQGQRALAQRIVGARRRRQVRVGVAARPRLDAGIEIKRALLLAQLDQRHARHVDRDVEQKIAGAEPRVEHVAVVVAAERRGDEVDAVLGGDIAAMRLGGDDRDLVRRRCRDGAAAAAGRPGRCCQSRRSGNGRKRQRAFYRAWRVARRSGCGKPVGSPARVVKPAVPARGLCDAGRVLSYIFCFPTIRPLCGGGELLQGR